MTPNFISKLQKKRCDYNYPDQATSQANSLNLLSSGIYTEEERFVFELLQNAVDAYNDPSGVLNVRMEIKEDYFVFLHNGDAFTERDIEGLCDVGNGNKMKDTKKIGYKGIGFKSVFMCSNNVTVVSGGYCFKFDKSHWDNYWENNWNGPIDEEKKYLMPWQIIPIETQPPIILSENGFNVEIYIQVKSIPSLEQKVLKLFSNSQFLLFLKSKNIDMEFIVNDKPICHINKIVDNNQVVLSRDGNEESRWLIHTNENVEVPSELKNAINADINTPDKLKDAKTFDLSFAIAIDNKGQLKRLENAVVYTYLPTSFQFGSTGFPFLVNANFITDAGRQQLHKDSEWNKLIFSKIPSEFLYWMKEISSSYKNYWEVLPEKSYGGGNALEVIYANEMQKAIEEVPFIPRLSNPKLKVLATDAVMDRMGISDAISKESLISHVNRKYNHSFSEEGFIANVWKGSRILNDYGVFIFDKKKLKGIFEDDKAFDDIDVEFDVKLIDFLFAYYVENKTEQEEFLDILQSTKFLLDENNNLQIPSDLFFPSSYKQQNEVVESAILLHPNVYKAFETNKQVTDWLAKLGVEQLSDITFIQNVICKKNYINKDNAVEAIRFLFEVNKKINIFEQVNDYYLKNLKFLSKKGNLVAASSLYLGSLYNPVDDLEKVYEGDIYISEDYCDGDYTEYGSFFRKFGINDIIEVKSLKFKEDSEIYHILKDYVTYATKHEYNHSTWTDGNYYMMFSYINIKYVPIISITKTPYQLAKFIWNKILTKPIELKRDDNYIYGPTGGGYIKKAYLSDREDGHMYLGENFLPWIIKKHQTFPASNGKLLCSEKLLLNTDYVKQVAGHYLPVIDIEGEIHDSWKDILMLRNTINIDDCLTILTNISKDIENIEQNKERIYKVYQRLVELDALSSNNKEKVKNWATTNLLLSKDNKFIPPSELSHITLDGFGNENRVYIEKPSDIGKVIELLSLMGVKIITEESISPKFENKNEEYELKKILLGKISPLSLVATGEKGDKNTYKEKKQALQKSLNNTHFYHCDKISLSYGNDNDVIEKQTFGSKNEFYYIGNLRPANVEPLLTPLCKFLDIKGKERELFILMIEDMDGIRQNLDDKGYDVSLLEEPISESGTLKTTLDYQPDLSAQERNMITGFKGEIIVYEKLVSMGYNPICPSISTMDDYEKEVVVNGKTYYCKTNYNKWDISFVTKNGHEILLEVKATTTNVGCIENMPISSNEWSMIKECDKEQGRSYVIVRVFGVDNPNQDIYLFKGHLLD